MRRGEIWWATLGAPQGSEPGYRRPVLVLQTDAFNASRIRTVVVAAITSNLRLVRAPGNVRCGRRQTGLDKPSVVNVSQIATIDKRRLGPRAGQLDRSVLRRVEDGVRLVLGL